MEEDSSSESGLSELATERLEQEMCDTASRIWAATARWIELVGEFDRREAWMSWGCRSTGEWLSWHCGVAPGTARDQVRVARQLTELPLTREAFASGGLSHSKVRALGRVATPGTEAELVEFARHATAGQLERVLAAYRRQCPADEATDATAAFDARSLDLSNDDDGSLVITARIPPDQADIVTDAMAAKAAELGRQDSLVSAETPSIRPRTLRQRRADALVELLGGAEPAPTEVVVHVDAATVVAEAGGGWRIGQSTPIDDTVGRMLSCDATVRAILHGPNDEVLDVGPATRVPSAALRRAVEARDGGCVVPGCNRTGRRHVDAHHVRFWGRDGGSTSLANLALLCRFHHRLVHQGRLAVEMVGGVPVCKGCEGRPLVRMTPTPIDLDDSRELLDRLGVPVATSSPRADGERLDYGLALDALHSMSIER